MNKDLGFFAKHTEKIVLGASVLLLLIVGAYAWLGVLGDPHATASGDTPGELEQKINTAAERVTAGIRSDRTNLPTEQEYIVPDYAQEFSEVIARPITQVERLASAMGGQGLPPDTVDGGVIDFDALFLPTPPMASSFSIKAKHGVLADPSAVNDPLQRNQIVEVQNLVGNQAPVDFQYISVMAEFPLQEWAKRLDATDQSPERQIPNNVWLAKLGIASVYLVREEQLPDGTWGNRTTVEPLPGQLAFLPGETVEPREPMAAQQILVEAQGRQADIMQPAFPPMALEAWTPPTGRDRVLSKQERETLNKIENDIKNLERRINALTGQDARAGNTRQRTQPGQGFDDGGMGLDGGMGVGGNTRQPSNANRPDRAAQEADRQRQQVERFEEELRAKIKEKNDLLGIDDDAAQMEFLRNRGGMDGGMGMGGMGGMGMGFDEFGDAGMMGGQGLRRPQPFGNRPGGQQPGQPNLGGLGVPANPTDDVPETVRVWAHDLTAQPGKTYRYKLVAAAINPLFQYTRLPSEQRKANEYRLAVAPSVEDFDAAPWTTPVTLDPEAYFFFVRGNADQDRAAIEVWKVYNGLWRQGEFEETPGNPIGGEQTVELVPGLNRTVSMGVGAVLLDVDVVEVNGTSQVRMVYLLPDGRIAGRLLSDDRNNAKRVELQRRVEEQLQQSQELAALGQ